MWQPLDVSTGSTFQLVYLPEGLYLPGIPTPPPLVHNRRDLELGIPTHSWKGHETSHTPLEGTRDQAYPPTPVDRMTGTSENITFPKLRWRAVIKQWQSYFQYGKECFCGNTYGKHGSASESECDTKCRFVIFTTSKMFEMLFQDLILFVNVKLKFKLWN